MGRSLDDLHPTVQHKAEKLIQLAKGRGIELHITSTYRSKEEQNELYAKGRTAGGSIVTNANYPYSLHNHRVALDVVPIVDGNAEWNDTELWNQIGELGKSIELEWGGDWIGFPDKPHFQYTEGLSIYDFINGRTLSDAVLPEEDDENSANNWAADAWKKAEDKGIISSTSMPRQSVTKEELMVFFDRANLFGDLASGETIATDSFASAGNPFISEWAVASWDKAYAKSIVGEHSKPQDIVTKEELMVFFDRLNVL